MESQRVSTEEPGWGPRVQGTASTLPDWRQVSAEHKQELMMILATMIVKQLTACPVEQRGEPHER